MDTKILLVDDAAFMRMLIKDTLTKTATPIFLKLPTELLPVRYMQQRSRISSLWT